MPIPASQGPSLGQRPLLRLPQEARRLARSRLLRSLDASRLAPVAPGPEPCPPLSLAPLDLSFPRHHSPALTLLATLAPSPHRHQGFLCFPFLSLRPNSVNLRATKSLHHRQRAYNAFNSRGLGYIMPSSLSLSSPKGPPAATRSHPKRLPALAKHESKSYAATF